MLNKFRNTTIRWDKAARKIHESLRVSSGDENGRKLTVQVVDGGEVVDLTGATLSLYWETRNKAHNGLDAFDPINAAQGEFEIYYTTGMLSNVGILDAKLVLVDSTGRVVSEPFKITVFGGIDDEAIESENSFTALTEALVKVENVEANYTPRLSTIEQKQVSVEQQLAQTVKKDETGVLNLNVFDESSRSVLQGQTPGTINAVLGNKNVKTENLDDHAVTLEKMGFVSYGTNLLDSSKNVQGKVIGTNGVETDHADYSHSAYIMVEPGQSYTLKNAHSIAYFNADKVFQSRTTTAAGDIAKRTITIPAGVHSIIINFNRNQGNPSESQVNKGSILLPYKAYRFPRLEGVSVDPNTLGVIGGGASGHTLTFGNGRVIYVLRDSGSSLTIESSTNIMYQNKRTSLPVGVYPIILGGWVAIIYDVAARRFRFLSASDVNGLNENEILFGVVDTTKREVYSSIANYTVETDDRTKQTLHKNVYFSAEDVPGDFTAPLEGLQTDGTGAEGFKDDVTRANDMYALYDQLMADHPAYITRTLMGRDASDTYDIFAYEFKPEERTLVPSGIPVQVLLPKRLPKLILQTAIHGGEKTGAYDLYWLAKGICREWRTNPVYEYLRWNVNLVIVPVANPWGWDNGTRTNANGVDLNRNFDNRWEFQTIGAGTGTYKGTAPFSEPESRHIRDLLIAHKDALWFADIHTNSGQTTDYDRLMWTIYSKNESAYAASSTLSRLSRKFKKEYPVIPDIPYLGYISTSDNFPYASPYAFKKLDIMATTLECFQLAPNIARDSQEVNKMNFEFIVNSILDVLKCVREKMK